MKFSCLICLLCIFNSNQVLAEDTPVLSDFANKRKIELVNEEPLHFFDLPDEIYETVVSSKLNDLRVFNAAGSVVPFEIKENESVSEIEMHSTSLPIFPIVGITKERNKNNTEVKVTEDSRGKIVSVHFDGQEEQSVTSNTFLVDLRSFDKQVESLKLQWESTEQMVSVGIQKSDDLKRWENFSSGVLANITYLGNSIIQDSIDAGFRSSKYLRISAPPDIPFKLHKVEAVYRKTDTRNPKKIITDGKFIEHIKDKNSYTYDSKGYLPIRSINILFKDQNIFTRLKISSKQTLNSQWVQRLDTTFYRIRINGTDITNGFLDLSTIVNDRYWLIESLDREVLLESPPAVSFKWLPQQVVFLAQGNQPFHVAYGSAKLKNNPYNSNTSTSLVKSIKVDLSPALLAASEEVSGVEVLSLPAPKKIIPWKKWLLWGFLTLALSLGMTMAAKLFKDLQNKKEI